MKKIIGLFFVIFLFQSYTYAQLGGVTSIASVDSGGTQSNHSATHPSISVDGRYIAFSSFSTNLVANDINGYTDIFVHDNQTGETTLVSVASDGTQSNFNSGYPSISDDGRFIVFTSIATNLVANDTNNGGDIFVHDRQTGQTTRISVASDGTQADGSSSYPVISGDGRFISFESAATTLVVNDTNGYTDIFVHDRQTGETTRVSVASDGTQANGNSSFSSLSTDGRYIVFGSSASNLVANDTNNATDIFVHDRQTGETTRASVASDDTQANNSSALSYISEDGRYIAFGSAATNLVANDTNNFSDGFVHDRQTGETTRVSVASDGTQANGNSGTSSLSNDGRYVLIYSIASNLVANDTNDFYDIFVHDRQTGETTRVSVASDGTQSNNTSSWSEMSGDGRYVTFDSYATNFIANDTNGNNDIFVHDRQTTLAVELSGNTTSIVEMNSGTHAVTSISLIVKGGISFIPVTIDCILTDGSTTVADNDYTQTNATVTIPAGDYTTPTTITIPIATLGIMGDTKVESNETFTLALQNPSTNIMIGDANGDLTTITSTVYTILNDDVASVTLNNVTLAEGNSGTTNFIFTATLDNAVQGGFTVNYLTNDDSATVANNDYANSTGLLTFVGVANETQIITVPINGDTIVEADETFTASLNNASSIDVTITSIGLGTILNDDVASVTLNTVTLAEGNSGTTDFIFTATLDNAVQGGFTVNYLTNDDSATVANNDYANSTGLLTFVGIANETQIITVPVNGDTILEADETFTTSLNNVSSMDVTITSIGIGTILNDEPATILITINEQMLFNAIIPHQGSEIELILPDIEPNGILVTVSFPDNAVATVQITFTVTNGMMTMTLNTPTFEQGYSSVHEATIYQNLIPIIMMALDDLLGGYEVINTAILNTSDMVFTLTYP
jgi:Tol biopolymer transport system component